MRRMYSEKGIYDTVNKGIQEGEISAGGVSPEQEAVLDLMGADNGRLGIYSDGVVMSDAEGDSVNFNFHIDENNVANIYSDFPINLNSYNDGAVTINGKSIPNILTIKAIFSTASATSTEVVLTADVVNKLFNNYYTLVILQAGTSAAITDCCVLYNSSVGTNHKYQGMSLGSNTVTINPRVPGIASSNQCRSYTVSQKYGTTDTLTITRGLTTVIQAEDVWGISVNLAGGTLSNTEYARLNNNKFQTPLILNNVAANTWIKLYNCFYSNSTAVYRSVLCTGLSAQYELTIDLSTKAYTVTTI